VRDRFLFGQLAIRLGFMTEEHLQDALRVQKERREAGEGHELIGNLLVELGHLSPVQVMLVLEAADKESASPRISQIEP
jgi:hypothetical protein